MMALFRKKPPVYTPTQEQNYKNVAQAMLTSIRRRLPEQSALLPVINDFGLYLRLDEQNYRPSYELIDIAKVADRTLASVRKLQNTLPGLHAMISIKSNTPRLWLSNAQMVESLLRNLLLASLSGLQIGVVYLRVEHFISEAGIHNLQITLEDSSPNTSYSHWQHNHDIPWPLIQLIVSSLGGEINQSQNNTQTGKISLSIPVKLPPKAEKTAAKTETGHKKLVLMVEDDRTNSMIQQKIFEDAGFEVFGVTNGADALEWAGVIPFSLILIDGTLPGISGQVVAARMCRMQRNGILGTASIAALTATDASRDRELWHKAGVEQILLKPLNTEDINKLSIGVSNSKIFYRERDSSLDEELLGASAKRLPAMQSELTQQVLNFCKILERPEDLEKIAYTAHAIKSAALPLGYYRLCGLASAIEHTIRADHGGNFQNMFAFIRNCLLHEFE